MAKQEPVRWKAFARDELERRQAAAERSYLEFLRVPTLSAGLYVLEAGAEDRQSPHEQDEVYQVLEGAARFAVDGEDVAVRAGDVLFVKAGVAHRFHDIESDLKVLVFFSAAAPDAGAPGASGKPGKAGEPDEGR